MAFGTPLAVPDTNGGGYIALCWDGKDRSFSTWAKNNANDPWQLEGSWSALNLDGSSTIYGARHPKQFRIGLLMLGWGTIPSRRYIGFRDFRLQFGTSSMLTTTDPTALAYTHVVKAGTGNRAVLSTPPYMPYSFTVAARSALGTQMGNFAGPANGASASCAFPSPSFPLSIAQMANNKLGFWWDFSRERPGQLAAVIDNAFTGNNPLTQTNAAVRPRISGGVVGPWSAWTARGDSFADAIPYPATALANGPSFPSQTDLLQLDGNNAWALFLVMRPAAAPTGLLHDVINKGPSAGDTTRNGWYVTARSNNGLPSVSMVMRAKGGAPDSYNVAGITRINATSTGVEVLTFRTHYAGPFCHGRSLEGYRWDSYVVGVNGSDPYGLTWPSPNPVGNSITPNATGWQVGASDADRDAWYRVGMEADGSAPLTSCAGYNGTWNWQSPGEYGCTK